jgi:hypothetical protein
LLNSIGPTRQWHRVDGLVRHSGFSMPIPASSSREVGKDGAMDCGIQFRHSAIAEWWYWGEEEWYHGPMYSQTIDLAV